ncbi:TIGR02530 family flagellar biosynthesis protein [Bacillus sp. FJAT-45037]|uniref:TIGR02530 family flagellar biosynthesis protein n=1 Tax=Bacillus sp. FJAT-45037 TaxID=2011007 RepID=UPI000C23B4E2|nr:TIGR02530 family flagellar biosynthesis protein [Bacillus sp. FJAT-45037]
MNKGTHISSVQSLPKPFVKKVSPQQSQPKRSFQTVLTEQLKGKTDLKMSKHATERMNQRGIEFDQQKWQTITDKVAEAKQKGVTESLVITNDATLLVSAKNSTVITVLDREEAKSQIFTNINGTIVIE